MFRFVAIPLFFIYLAFLFSCRKENTITSADARISVSADTLHFDTVFTSVGSVTQTLKIFNPNDQKIRLASVKLAGGQTSFFHLNIDGVATPELSDVEILSNDSLYVFVTVSINPNAEQLPFIVQDSIEILCNGNNTWVQLQAYGQNAHFLKNAVISENTTWVNDLPYVILGPLQVDTGAVLEIRAGSRIYLHADAPLIVDGTLRVTGTKPDSVVFRGDRLDEDYRDLPASWPGIYFRATSNNNVLQYTILKNAYQGLVADQPSGNASPKLRLEECIVDNIYDAGIIGNHSSISARNCLISNCGLNVLLIRGGDYSFTHCTVASYSNAYFIHKNPVLYLNNWDSTNNQVTTYDLRAEFINNIFWGENGTVDDEVVVSRAGANLFQVLFNNNLFKALNLPPDVLLNNNIVNENPLFDSVNAGSGYYDFHLQTKPSPAVDAGISTGITFDLDGFPRDGEPDMGSYEKH